jgi:hypothetical protein
MMLLIFLLIVLPLSIIGIYESFMTLTSIGFEYQPQNSIQLIATKTIQTKILCSMACNQLTSCRTFDYDLVSQRCRLFEGDSTTGSIISSSSSTSVVGTVYISSNLYSSVHNQPCQMCQQDRYVVCSKNTGSCQWSSNTSSCQCPPNTYWNGSVCALQLFENDTCGQSDTCRSDANLTCISANCYVEFAKCLPSPFIGKQTIFSYN